MFVFLDCALECAADGIDVAAKGERTVQFGVDGEEVGCETFFGFLLLFFVVGGKSIMDDRADAIV